MTISVVIIAVLTVVIEFLPIKNRGSVEEVSVVIPEGKTLIEIDQILKREGVLANGESLLNIPEPLEGYLFPDTYRFYKNSRAVIVAQRFFENFRQKAQPILMEDPANWDRNLIIASILEKEVPFYKDKQLVSGLINRRLEEDMPLQIDATLCYIKLYSLNTGSWYEELLESTNGLVDFNNKNCYPISQEDKWADSPFNTYLHKGLPPSPIANPGEDSLRAAINPKESPYLFFISDPLTRQTVFSSTLAEHNANIDRYLRNN